MTDPIVPEAIVRDSRSQGEGFDWSLPYRSRRQPIFARNVVATSQPLATQAGIATLQKGGNALDAALATAITLTVVEPCSNGVGSDLFAIVSDRGDLVGLNASGRAPAAVRPSSPICSSPRSDTLATALPYRP